MGATESVLSGEAANAGLGDLAASDFGGMFGSGKSPSGSDAGSVFSMENMMASGDADSALKLDSMAQDNGPQGPSMKEKVWGGMRDLAGKAAAGATEAAKLALMMPASGSGGDGYRDMSTYARADNAVAQLPHNDAASELNKLRSMANS